MAFKRKESTRDENPKKRARVNTSSASTDKKDSERPNKRQAKESKPGNESKTGSAAVAAPPQSTISIKEDEDTPFPRGGNSVLTPLEQKQISLQAKRDVLFEQNGGKAKSKGKKDKKPSGGDELEFSGNEDDDSDEDMMSADEEDKKDTKKKGKKSKKSKKDKGDVKEKQGVKIEGLSFKVGDTFSLRLVSFSSSADS